VSDGAPNAVQYAFTARDKSEPTKLTSPNSLGEALATQLRTQVVSYDLQLRFYTDATQTPIEDASVEWSSPWHTVGQLILPVQDPDSARGQKVQALVEQLAFDPWHARTDMRPLGNIMRARNVAYRSSTRARKATAEPREAPIFEELDHIARSRTLTRCDGGSSKNSAVDSALTIRPMAGGSHV